MMYYNNYLLALQQPDLDKTKTPALIKPQVVSEPEKDVKDQERPISDAREVIF